MEIVFNSIIQNPFFFTFQFMFGTSYIHIIGFFIYFELGIVYSIVNVKFIYCQTFWSIWSNYETFQSNLYIYSLSLSLLIFG